MTEERQQELTDAFATAGRCTGKPRLGLALALKKAVEYGAMDIETAILIYNGIYQEYIE